MAAESEKITAHILLEAQSQAEEFIDAAQKQADDAVARTARQANEQAEELLIMARREAEEGTVRTMAVADLTLRKKLLSQKRVVVDEAFTKAEQTLKAYDDDAFAKIYEKLVLDAVQKGDEGISPAKADVNRLDERFIASINQALIQKGLLGKVTLLPIRDGIQGGCIVISGDMEIDLSIQSVLHSVRERTEGEVAQILFAFLEG